MSRRLREFLRELQWLAIFSVVLAVVCLAYSVFTVLTGDYVSSVFGVGFAGLIIANLARDA